MNRGSADSQYPGLGDDHRFNEAPIHESGKCGGRQRTVAAAVGASMRPRFMNRGSRRRLPCADTIHVGFNEAPIHESGKFEYRETEVFGTVPLQ